MFSTSLLLFSINDISVINWSFYFMALGPSVVPIPSYRYILAIIIMDFFYVSKKSNSIYVFCWISLSQHDPN